ncbi:MAG: hypothetical protein A3D67_00290 [Candidatus Lloydbacteria bacterium RIFCSPHIGHO2_02_FULL_51_22]|uniref:Lipid/polyisoprenoid-binding YceI-like domain-containing protein n=2 Tax=Candidatus Lloydiibacteriota TaxID=1817910 RepID=A0A1G2DDZ7_9BACT|nr:MAG: hypothetical protein A3D67_00290 [Candidatus Lloydbacteria bacterium RIFCSPHIGHO2_02_FULL_51_22]OGZ15309.1 MAG: hypothetical protein A3J08_00835 [Candidatus Lloydbacteria bacterium RIFCSPLOWO2_02_FULL_51_11]
MQNYSSLLVFTIVLLVAAFGAFFYLTRPALAPTENPAPLQSGVSGEGIHYEVVPEESSAEFSIGEVLNGKENIVVGTTKNLTGAVTLDVGNPKEAIVGLFRVNARTLKTDSERRDGVVSRSILRSDEPANEFIEFKTRAIVGLPEKIEAATGEFSFQIVGDLTIAGVTREVSWDAHATVTSEKITASAGTKVLYSDFGLSVPQVPFVASVEKEVSLTITLVAVRGAGAN